MTGFWPAALDTTTWGSTNGQSGTTAGRLNWTPGTGALTPDRAINYMARASAYRDQGRLELALQDYGKAIELEPHRAEYYLFRGELLIGMEEPREAQADLERALRLGHDRASMKETVAAATRSSGSTTCRERNTRKPCGPSIGPWIWNPAGVESISTGEPPTWGWAGTTSVQPTSRSRNSCGKRQNKHHDITPQRGERPSKERVEHRWAAAASATNPRAFSGNSTVSAGTSMPKASRR